MNNNSPDKIIPSENSVVRYIEFHCCDLADADNFFVLDLTPFMIPVSIWKVGAAGSKQFNPLNAELNPICHLLALLAAHHILHVSSIRVNTRH